MKKNDEKFKYDGTITYRDWYFKKMGNPKPTQEIKIEGVGSVKVYGEIDVEKLIIRLLESKAITGY